jgi:hypothetical protein
MAESEFETLPAVKAFQRLQVQPEDAANRVRESAGHGLRQIDSAVHRQRLSLLHLLLPDKPGGDRC